MGKSVILSIGEGSHMAMRKPYGILRCAQNDTAFGGVYMIPKILHYCWFGGKELPPLAERCLESWRRCCPEFEIRQWNEQNFDLSQAPEYVRQAMEAGRWAFVTDFVRLAVLMEYGGVYLDTDVELVKPLTPYLRHRAFAGFETVDRVQTGLLACEPGFDLFRQFLAHYDTAVFRREDGSLDVTTNVEVLTRLCVERGLRPDGRKQEVAGLTVYPKAVFCPVEFESGRLRRSPGTVAIHWFSGSWHTQAELDQIELERKQREAQRRSETRVRVGTAIFGKKGYEWVKEKIKKI